jgi:hypothetical protein
MAIKPVRTQAKQVAAFINGVPTRRVQSFDWASNFTTDSVYELGNAGIVEDSVTLVETSITMNSYEWGNTDLEAMIFGIHQSRNCVGNNSTKTWTNTIATILVAARGAGGKWDSTYASLEVNDYLQVYRFNHHATLNDTEYVKVSAIGAVDVNGAFKVTLASGNRLTAPCGTSDIVSIVNKYTIDQDTVDSNPCHIVLPHRYSNTATTIMHSIILPRCFVDNLTYNFDTGGASEQNYTLVGEEERMLLGAWREVHSIAGSFMSYGSSAHGTVRFKVPIYSLAALGTPYAVYAGSNLVTVNTGTVGNSANGLAVTTAAHATIIACFGSGLGIDSTTQIIYYFSNRSGRRRGYKGLTNIDGTMGKLTKGNIEITLQVGTGDTDTLLRCTGVSINIPLTRESIDELGETRSISKPLEGNLRNELTLTFSRNDLREYAQLLGTENNFDSGTVTEILMSNLKSITDANIVIKFYASQTTHDATTLLKTMTYNNCSFIGDSATTPISGAAGLELKFSTQSVDIVGSGLKPVSQ